MEQAKVNRYIGAKDDDKEYYDQYFNENDGGYFWCIL